MNDDCQTPLEVARAMGHSNVVRAIEVCIMGHAVMSVLLHCVWKMWENNMLFTMFLLIPCRVIFLYSLVGCGSFMGLDF